MRTRQQPRKQIDIPGQYRTSRGLQRDVHVVDISDTGCRLCEPRGELAVGEIITLYIAGTGPHRGRLKWRVADIVGINFNRPIQAPLLDQIRHGHIAGWAAPIEYETFPAGESAIGPLRSV